MKKIFIILVAALSISTVSGCVSQDVSEHYMECMATAANLSKSQDDNIRRSSPVVFAYYLGRLSQIGLTAEKIHMGVQRIVLSPEKNLQVIQKDFADRCADAPNTMIKDMNGVQARELDRLKQQMAPH